MLILDEDLFLELVQDPDLTADAWRALMYLLCLSESEEADIPEGSGFYFPHGGFIEDLNMEEERFAKALALLHSKKILARKPGPQGMNVYEINLDDGWEEITQELQKARKSKPALKLIDGGKPQAPADPSPKSKAKPRKHRPAHINAEEDP